MADDQDLADLRKLFSHDTQQWAEARKEGQKDILCAAGKTWQAMDPKGLKLRNERSRPALDFDEFGQYINALNNDVRQNKRAVQVTAMPARPGSRSTEQLESEAELRATLIRQIEYRSNAPSGAYTTMFEDAVQRSYGALRIVAEYLDDESFDQELLIKPVFNPDQLTVDAEALDPTGADMRHCFYDEWWSKDDFIAQFGEQHANVGLNAATAPQWVRENAIRVSEYWRITTKTDTLLLVRNIETGETLSVLKRDMGTEALPAGFEVARERPAEVKRVRKQLTNGYEWLAEAVDWPGRFIPFVLCLGKVLYLDEGGGSKRELQSYIRKARGPAMLYNYELTSIAEAFGGVSRAQWVGYEGQFRGHELDWQKANKEPVAFLEARATTEEAGQSVLPLPQRQSWDPPVQNMMIAAEGARRAIQSAMGSNFLPTDAQNRNQKSGKALDKITSMGQKGSYHFIDHFEDSLRHTGVVLNDLLAHYYDTARDVTVRQPDDSAQVVRINDPQQPDSVQLTPGGQFDITLGTGPSHDSQREQVSDFVDVLVGLGPEMFALFGDLLIKLKALGPYGDEMAERAKTLLPPAVRQMEQQKAGDPQQQAAELQATKAQLAQVEQAAGQMQKALETEQVKAQAQQQTEVMKTQAQKETEAAKLQATSELQLELQRMKDATAIRIAEINAAVKGYTLEASHAQEHEIQAGAQVHEAVESELSRQHATTMGLMGQAHEAAMGERGHEQALEAGEAATEGQMGLAEQQAELQPPAEGAE